MSVEHHMRIETQFHNVRNWEIYALQTEEENPAGAEANALDVQDSQNLLFANTYMYRVSRNVLPKTHAILVRRSSGIAFQNVKTFSQTRLAFDNPVFAEDGGVLVRPHYFTTFTVNQGMKTPAAVSLPAVFDKNVKLEKLAGDFSNASGLTASDKGEIFFSDANNRKIYHWNDVAKKAELLATTTGQPQVLGFVAPSNLLAIANEKAVVNIKFSPPGPDGVIPQTQPEAVNETADILTDTALLLPIGLHNQLFQLNDMVKHHGYIFRSGSNTAIQREVDDEHRGLLLCAGHPGRNHGWRHLAAQSPKLATGLLRARPNALHHQRRGRAHLARQARQLQITLDDSFCQSRRNFCRVRRGRQCLSRWRSSVDIRQVRQGNRRFGNSRAPQQPGLWRPGQTHALHWRPILALFNPDPGGWKLRVVYKWATAPNWPLRVR